MNPLLKAALVKVDAERSAVTGGLKKKASWYDLSPAVRRAIVGAGVGTAAGAGIGVAARRLKRLSQTQRNQSYGLRHGGELRARRHGWSSPPLLEGLRQRERKP